MVWLFANDGVFRSPSTQTAFPVVKITMQIIAITVATDMAFRHFKLDCWNADYQEYIEHAFWLQFMLEITTLGINARPHGTCV